MRRPAALLALVLGARLACARKPAVPDSQADGAANEAVPGAAATARPPEVERAWDEAMLGQADELARLAGVEGPAGLAERAGDPARRLVALRAMGYTNTFDGLPLLGDAAAHDPEPFALAAVESAAMLAARRRRPTDPEDALELHDGCAKLGVAAADGTRPAEVRAGAARARWMLVEWGCSP